MLTDWRLRYSNVDFGFGTVASKYVFPQDGPPSLSNSDITDQDADRPRGDGLLFGSDYRGGTLITFDVKIDGKDEQDANDLLQSFGQAWRADYVRAQPGRMASLTAHTGRTVFGRPRRFQPNYELTPFGLTVVTCDFQAADDLWYGAENITTIKLIPDLGGGVVAPLASPVSTTASSDRSQVIRVGGTAATWPVIKIQGPITNPEVEVLGQFKLAFNLRLESDQTLTIDTRPWARSITRNGANVSGSLRASGSRLSDASLTPGIYDVALRGISDLGTAQTQFIWRDAFPSM